MIQNYLIKFIIFLMMNSNQGETKNFKDINHHHKKYHQQYTHNSKNFPFNRRTWVPNIDINNNNNESIRVVTYNILCDSLLSISTQISEEDISYMPFLHWENRRKKILDELNELNGDIVCIQEFERDEVLIDNMGKMGYDCAFKPRPGDHSEGCAIFWKMNKFQVENLYALEFNMNITNKNLSSIYDRDNVCIFAVFKYLPNPNFCFIVANGHLLFNNNRGDIKLAQSYQILNSLKILKEFYRKNFNYKYVNILFCCDLNSLPNSGVYKLLTEGTLDCTNLDRRRISGQNQNGSIEKINPSKFKPIILTNVTSKFREESNKNLNYFDNESWFNDIVIVESVYDYNTHSLQLCYKNNHKNVSGDLILKSDFVLKSAYGENLRKILDFLKNKTKIFPFDQLDDHSKLEGIEVYGIKMGFTEIDKTLNFVKNLTLEPPMSFYGKGFMSLLDYIFYEGDLTPFRTLNIPDINKMAFNEGYIPTETFPSDHISLCCDFLLLEN